jgi:5,10-methylene-tetrahydrofolate dehydrogenase/methenyl tetrahydrofolate cyclohydrolase
MDEKQVIDSVALHKDVDAFHPQHMGLVARREKARFLPCTAHGCIELLQRSGIEISGKHVVVLGRSKLVGLPVSLLLLNLDATVTICHSKTKDIASVVGQADILVVAIGKPEFVRGSWVKDGVVVIDVGINGVPDATRKSGQRLVGDVNFAEVEPKASLITPVPGGVGPMTYVLYDTQC